MPIALADTVEATTMTMSSLITTIGTVFEGVLGWAGTVGNTIAGNPLLLFGVVLGFIGVGVGLFKRMLNV